MRTYYERVSWWTSKNGLCVVCGKKAKREKRFTNTLSPFNVNDDGSVRTRAEVDQHLRELAEAWQQEPLAHAGCES